MCITIVLLTLAILAVAVLLSVIGVTGGVLLVLFGDIIVFAAIVWLIVKIIKFFKKKK